MSTDSGTTRPVRVEKERRTSDPLQMTAAEKCMAEWEARHDVSARGGRSSPEALQHYVARSRLSQPVRPHPATTPPPTAHERQEAVPPAPTARRRSLLARLLHRPG